MKQSSALVFFIVLVFIVSFPLKSAADENCLVFCDESEDQVLAEEEDDEGGDSESSGGEGDTIATNNSNTVVIGGDVITTQSNYIGGIGTNSGDINQSNSANIVGQQNENTQNNDMRSFRDRNRRKD